MAPSIEERLRSYCALLDDTARVHAAESTREPVVAPPPRSRRELRVGLAIAAVAALIVGVVVLARPGDHSRSIAAETRGSSSETSIGATTTASVQTNTTIGPAESTPAAGSWTDVAPPPLSPREDAGVVWTGTEFIVWGGRDGSLFLSDGAAYNPTTDSWRPIASNEAAFPGVASAWTGSSMVVLIKDGGAMYDLASDSWADLPAVSADESISQGQFFQAAFWDGTDIIGVGSRFDASGTSVVAAAALRPGSDEWRMLPPSPMPAAQRPAADATQFVQTPTGFAAWAGGPHGVGWEYDAATQLWSALPELDMPAAWTLQSSVLTTLPDGTLVVVANESSAAGPDTVTARLVGDTWQWGARSFPIGSERAVAVGDDLVLSVGTNADMSMRGLLDTRTGAPIGTWLQPGLATTGQAVSWNGTELFMWGGRVPSYDDTGRQTTDVEHVTSDGQLWHPATAAFPQDRVDVGCIDINGTRTLSAQQWYDPSATGVIVRTGNVQRQSDAANALAGSLTQQLPGYSVADASDWAESAHSCAILRVVGLTATDGSSVTVTIWQLVAPGALWIPHVEPFEFRDPDLFVSESGATGDRTVIKVLPDGTTIKIVALGADTIDVSGWPTTIAPQVSTSVPQPAPQTAGALVELADVVARQLTAAR